MGTDIHREVEVYRNRRNTQMTHIDSSSQMPRLSNSARQEGVNSFPESVGALAPRLGYQGLPELSFSTPVSIAQTVPCGKR